MPSLSKRLQLSTKRNKPARWLTGDRAGLRADPKIAINHIDGSATVIRKLRPVLMVEELEMWDTGPITKL